MRYSDVLEKHIYNVIFNPVKQSEFDGTHLALVVKKNKDKRTAIVVPLTTSSNGDGVNKFNVGKIPSLPPNLRKDDSYAVFNQVRTVNVSRFMALKDDSGNRINVDVNDILYNKILSLCLDELGDTLSGQGKIDYYYNRYVNLVIEMVINTSYDIKRLIKENPNDKEAKLKFLQSQIKGLLSLNIVYTDYIEEHHKSNGIVEIINQCLNDSIVEYVVKEEVSA